MVDYSSQKPLGVRGQHAEVIDLEGFAFFLRHTAKFDFDIMLEIKNKERSAIEAFNLAINDWRIKRVFA
jgi:UV DNA damage endonuclease